MDQNDVIAAIKELRDFTEFSIETMGDRLEARIAGVEVSLNGRLEARVEDLETMVRDGFAEMRTGFADMRVGFATVDARLSAVERAQA